MKLILKFTISLIFSVVLFYLAHSYFWTVEVASTGHNEISYGLFSWHHHKSTMPMWEGDPTVRASIWTIRHKNLIWEISFCLSFSFILIFIISLFISRNRTLD